MVNERPKILVVLADYTVYMRPAISKAANFECEFLEIPQHIRHQKRDMEDQVARHLMHNEYPLVLMDASLDFLDAVRAQHLGKTVVYGTEIQFTWLDNLSKYDGAINVMDVFLRRDSSMARSIESFLN